MTLGCAYIERSRMYIQSVFDELERTSVCRKKWRKSVISMRCDADVKISGAAQQVYTYPNNELQPISLLALIRQGPESSQLPTDSRSEVEVFNCTKPWESLSTCDRTSAHLQFLDHATWRFVTEQFKLAACTIPPAGSKLERRIKIFDSGRRKSDGVE